jgi:hypothetical protein
VSGLLSINNILNRRIYFNDELHAAKDIWSEFKDLENVLNNNGLILKNINLINHIDDGSKRIYFVDLEKRYFILKRYSNDGVLFMLDPMKAVPEQCDENIWQGYRRILRKYPDREAIRVFEVLESNSSIIINKINTNSDIHHDNYGKKRKYNILFYI